MHGFHFEYPLRSTFRDDCAAILVGFFEHPTVLKYISKSLCQINILQGFTLWIDRALSENDIQNFVGATPPKSIDIDAQWLLEKKACEGGFKWFISTYGLSKVNSLKVIQQLKDEKKETWRDWLVAKLMA